MTDEDRKRMQREMLDSTTPEFRAQMGEYIKKIQTRRQERGLPNFGPPA
jgi:Spy/CpxP family protein refolding chaperone